MVQNSGESGSEIVARLKRDLLPTLINGAMFWPVCDFVTFKFVPVHLQVCLACHSSVSFFSYQTLSCFKLNQQLYIVTLLMLLAAIDEQFVRIFVDHLSDIHGKLEKSGCGF